MRRDTSTVATDVIDYLETQSLVLTNVPEMFKEEFKIRYFEFYPEATQELMESALEEACSYFKI
jgi:Trm5-related predicted tRNA methylase